MSVPKPLPPISSLDGEVTGLFGQLSAAQAGQLQAAYGFSRPTLESVLRQLPPKKQLWLDHAKALVGSVTAAVVTADETRQAKSKSKSASPAPPP